MTAYKFKITLLSLYVIISSLVAFAQNPEADSLKTLLSNTTIDTVRVFLMYKISDAYSTTEPLTALEYADSALTRAREIHFERGQARSLTRIGNIYSSKGEFDTSLGAHLASLKISESLHDEKGIAATYNNIALVYTMRNLEEDYKYAIRNFINAKTYYEKLKDSANLCTVLLNIGDGYEKMNMLDSAAYFANKAREIAVRIEDYENLGVILINIGYVHYKNGDVKAALTDFHSGIRYMKLAGDNHSLATAWYSLSLCFEKIGRADSSLYYANKAAGMARLTSNLPTLHDAARQLSKLYATAKKHDSAYVYQLLASSTDSTINNIKSVTRIEQLKFQEQNRQKGIIAKREADAQHRIETLQKVMIVGFIVTLILALIIFSRRKFNLKAMQALSFLTLLLAFEFITFTIHPVIERVTHHNPIYMVLILAGVAAILGPLHHRLTHWLKHKLIHKNHHHHHSHRQTEEVALTESEHHKKADHKHEVTHEKKEDDVQVKTVAEHSVHHKKDEKHHDQSKHRTKK